MSTTRSDNQTQRGSRPTLPPIRDLFLDELSLSPRAGHDSLTLARLCVHDDEDIPPTHVHTSSSRSHGSLIGPGSRPSLPRRFTPPPTQRPYDPSTFTYPQQPHGDPPSRSSAYTSPMGHIQSKSFPNAHRGAPGAPPSPYLRSGRSMSYEPSPLQQQGYPPSMGYPSSYRNSLPTDYRYDSRDPHQPVGERHSADHYRMSRSANVQAKDQHSSFGYHPPRPWTTVSTSIDPQHRLEDDERTPIAPYRESSLETPTNSFPNLQSTQDDGPSGSTTSTLAASKYDCSFCGKGFNRPSSLKIHLNSHTGEKPFICPVEGCGRSFSVLSNMRRHARVHSQTSLKQQEFSSNEVNEQPSLPLTAAPLSSLHRDSSEGLPTVSPQHRVLPSRWQHRRDSSASTSSTNSRRSRSVSSDDDGDNKSPPEKRIRHLPK